MHPESSGKITFPASGTNHLNSKHFLRFTLSHHSMMIPASVLLPGALLPFGEPLPEGFSLPFSVSPVPEFSPGNAGEEPPDSASLLSRAFSFDACVPSGRLSCSEMSFSCVSEALPVSFSDSSLPLPASWLSSAPLSCDGNCRRLGRLRQCFRFCLFRTMNACI